MSNFRDERFIYRLRFNQTIEYLQCLLERPDRIRDKDRLKSEINKVERLVAQIIELDIKYIRSLSDSKAKEEELKVLTQDAEKLTNEYNTVKKAVEKLIENSEKGGKILKKVGWFALKTAAISGAVLGGVAMAVPALGFTAGGVAAGSLAAAYQSAALGGTIASGSAFAILQSVGAAGLAAGTQAAVVAGSAVVSGVHTVLKK